MTTSSTTVDVSSFTTDAKFRTWGSAVSAALTDSGLTQTADTGQINWTTVTKPTAGNTKAGYEIWRFNDSLQATKPIFFRIDYGSSNVAGGNSPSTWLTVGTGTDGAGTITGVGAPVVQSISTNAAPTNATCTVGASWSSSAGSCTILGGLSYAGSTAHAGLWSISRTCNGSTGEPDGTGVWTLNIGTGGNPAYVGATFNPASLVTPYASGSTSGALKNGTVSSASVVYLYKNYALMPLPYPVNGSLGYYSSDIANMATFTAAPFGATHTYLALGSVNSSAYNYLLTGSFCVALIWE